MTKLIGKCPCGNGLCAPTDIFIGDGKLVIYGRCGVCQSENKFVWTLKELFETYPPERKPIEPPVQDKKDDDNFLHQLGIDPN